MVKERTFHFGNEVVGRDRGLLSKKIKKPLSDMTLNMFTWTAYITGVFPVRNMFLRGSQVVKKPLQFKWISLPVLYSMLIFLIKVMLLVPLFSLTSQFNHSSPYRQKRIDMITGGISFMLTFCSGIVAHHLLLFSRRGIVRIFSGIEAYTLKYGLNLQGRKITSKVIVNNAVGLFMVMAPLHMVWNVVATGKKPLILSPCPFHPNNLSTEDPILICIYLIIAEGLLEYAVLYLYGELFVLSNAMERRLYMLTETVQEISGLKQVKSRNDPVPTFTVSWKGKAWSSENDASRWTQLGQQYLDFHDLFQIYEKEMSPNFILLFSNLVFASICTVFYVMNSKSPIVQEIPINLNIAVLFSFYRIYALADCGEGSTKNYRALVGTMLRVNQAVKLGLDERHEFKRALTVIRNLPVTISARGFFTVNRACVTSLLSVIITYIVVLLQFRLSDDKEVNQQGAFVNSSSTIM